VIGAPHLGHLVFEVLALGAGLQLYLHLKRQAGEPGLLARGNYAVALGCLIGAAIGNKLVFWLEVPHLFERYGSSVMVWFTGQSMVGGLLGGLIGVEIAKRSARIRYSTGDFFVFPILLGLIIGRIGCFLAGLEDGTYGVATSLPWGVDFGDGVRRHPTQLYEVAAATLAWPMLALARARLSAEPGLLFKLLLSGYLVWRLVIDFLKPVPYAYPGGLSGIQWICLIALAVYLPLTLGQMSKLRYGASTT
jgi:phosphatidylglycerol---prolipoprotein diacylglyceryl transferase